MDKEADAALRAWCDKVAALGVDMVIEHDVAKNLVAEEIRTHIVMGDRPSDSLQGAS